MYCSNGLVLRDLKRSLDRMIKHYANPADALEAERLIVERFRDPSLNYHISWWTTTQALVAPRSLKRAPDIDNALDLSAHCDWPVYFRQTGGSVVPQGAGILNVTIAFALDPIERPSIIAVYEMFCAPIIRWLQKQGCDARTGFVPDSFCDGEFNVVVQNRKVAGTAQRWPRIQADEMRQIVFAHALLLMDARLEAGVAAINQLYKCCSVKQVIKPSKQVNIRDVLMEPSDSWQTSLVKDLSDMYRNELVALTS